MPSREVKIHRFGNRDVGEHGSDNRHHFAFNLLVRQSLDSFRKIALKKMSEEVGNKTRSTHGYCCKEDARTRKEAFMV